MARKREQTEYETPAETPADPTTSAGDGTAMGEQPPAAPKESKRDRFLRLVGRRVDMAVKRIRHVQNLANRTNYSYTANEGEQVSAAIIQATDSLVRAFAHQPDGPSGFKLK